MGIIQETNDKIVTIKREIEAIEQLAKANPELQGEKWVPNKSNFSSKEEFRAASIKLDRLFTLREELTMLEDRAALLSQTLAPQPIKLLVLVDRSKIEQLMDSYYNLRIQKSKIEALIKDGKEQGKALLPKVERLINLNKNAIKEYAFNGYSDRKQLFMFEIIESLVMDRNNEAKDIVNIHCDKDITFNDNDKTLFEFATYKGSETQSRSARFWGWGFYGLEQSRNNRIRELDAFDKAVGRKYEKTVPATQSQPTAFTPSFQAQQPASLSDADVKALVDQVLEYYKQIAQHEKDEKLWDITQDFTMLQVFLADKKSAFKNHGAKINQVMDEAIANTNVAKRVKELAAGGYHKLDAQGEFAKAKAGFEEAEKIYNASQRKPAYKYARA